VLQCVLFFSAQQKMLGNGFAKLQILFQFATLWREKTIFFDQKAKKCRKSKKKTYFSNLIYRPFGAVYLCINYCITVVCIYKTYIKTHDEKLQERTICIGFSRFECCFGICPDQKYNPKGR
jgi:hypothetical protein